MEYVPVLRDKIAIPVGETRVQVDGGGSIVGGAAGRGAADAAAAEPAVVDHGAGAGVAGVDVPPEKGGISICLGSIPVGHGR